MPDSQKQKQIGYESTSTPTDSLHQALLSGGREAPMQVDSVLEQASGASAVLGSPTKGKRGSQSGSGSGSGWEEGTGLSTALSTRAPSLDAEPRSPGSQALRKAVHSRAAYTSIDSAQERLDSMEQRGRGAPRINAACNPIAEQEPPCCSPSQVAATSSHVSFSRRKVTFHSGSSRRAVPLPLAERTPAGDSSALIGIHSHPFAHSHDMRSDSAELGDIESGSSFGLSCGLPGLSPEVVGTISNYTAAEDISRTVVVSALTMKDWLMRPVPHAHDPTMTLYGAAVHNAHVDCSQLLIGGLLNALEEGQIPEPQDLPRSMSDFERGTSRNTEVSRIVAAFATWLEGLVSGPRVGDVWDDPRTFPFLGVLHSEALQKSTEVCLVCPGLEEWLDHSHDIVQLSGAMIEMPTS
jgi:hypothetical protein